MMRRRGERMLHEQAAAQDVPQSPQCHGHAQEPRGYQGVFKRSLAASGALHAPQCRPYRPLMPVAMASHNSWIFGRKKRDGYDRYHHQHPHQNRVLGRALAFHVPQACPDAALAARRGARQLPPCPASRFPPRALQRLQCSPAPSARRPPLALLPPPAPSPPPAPTPAFRRNDFEPMGHTPSISPFPSVFLRPSASALPAAH